MFQGCRSESCSCIVQLLHVFTIGLSTHAPGLCKCCIVTSGHQACVVQAENKYGMDLIESKGDVVQNGKHAENDKVNTGKR